MHSVLKMHYHSWSQDSPTNKSSVRYGLLCTGPVAVSSPFSDNLLLLHTNGSWDWWLLLTDGEKTVKAEETVVHT